MPSTPRSVYTASVKRIRMESIPPSAITAQTVATDGFTLSQKDMEGITTTWAYDPATGLELGKTYADNSSVAKTYDAFNRQSTETNARGIAKNYSYEHKRGLLLGTTYSDGTTARSYQYNHLGQLTQVVDDAGTRTIGYNEYGEQESDSLLANGVTHLITETRDDYGRSTGYAYSKNGSIQQTVTTGYGTDGRIATAGFLHGGVEKQFGYSYLPGSDLLQSLSMPNNMTLTQSYEANRDLLTGMYYKRGTTGVVEREYSYDALGRPTTRRTARQGTTKNDTFAYNNRSELVAATVSGESYSYAYDNIGNRKSAQEAAEEVTSYTANALNQYTAIDDFSPTYDLAGNQTLVKTSTGIWSVQYNAENRPILFTRTEAAGTETQIACTYDTMGRRATKQVTENGSVTLNQRYIYRGYLQIAACDQTRSGHPCLWLMLWDPTQPIATRPLAIRKDGTWYCYGWDLTKNVCEVFGQHGYVRTAYAYTPYGSVASDGDAIQPLQWSSEYAETELGLTYYNYRHYNPKDGRWSEKERRFSILERNLYIYCLNNPISLLDELGNLTRGQREIKRRNARGQQKTGRFLNKEKIRQEEIDNSANQRAGDYSNPRAATASGVNLVDNVLSVYTTLSRAKATSTLVYIEKNIGPICQQAKAQYNNIKENCEGCCTIDIVVTYYYMEGAKVYDGIKSYKAHYSALSCNKTSYMRAPDEPFTTTFDVEIPMYGDTVII